MKSIKYLTLNEGMESRARLAMIDRELGSASTGLYLVDATNSTLLSTDAFMKEISPYLVKLVNLYQQHGTKVKIALVFDKELIEGGRDRMEFLSDRGVLAEDFEHNDDAEAWLRL